jgi:hypothetical protein
MVTARKGTELGLQGQLFAKQGPFALPATGLANFQAGKASFNGE